MAKKTLTTNQGFPVADGQNSLSAGQRVPVLHQVVHLIEKLIHFDREWIPERVVHAKDAGALRLLPDLRQHGAVHQGTISPESKEENAGFPADAGVGRSPCSNTLTIAAAEATVRQVGRGTFKSPQWKKTLQ